MPLKLSTESCDQNNYSINKDLHLKYYIFEGFSTDLRDQLFILVNCKFKKW